MSTDDRLRLAFVAMHPDRRRTLLGRHGSAGAVLRRIASGSIDVPAAAKAAAAVSAEERRTALAVRGIAAVMAEDLPEQLAQLPDVPDVLFVRGALPTEPGVAIVGSRRATTYGRTLARSLGAAAGRHWPIISGLARGVDGAAHEGTVAVGGCGVAVLGCGIDRWYPAAHRRLGEQLLERGGAVVSEYPPGTPPTGWRFPPRNRIISGLAEVVVIVEAAVPSGAMITARLALEQGRSVFAVPGDVDRQTSAGCNLLIRDGAWPVFGPDDLVASLGASPPPPVDSPMALGPNGTTVDEIAATLGVPVEEALRTVARWELDGAVRRAHGRVLPGGA